MTDQQLWAWCERSGVDRDGETVWELFIEGERHWLSTSELRDLHGIIGQALELEQDSGCSDASHRDDSGGHATTSA